MRCLVVVQMQAEEIDVIGVQPAQTPHSMLNDIESLAPIWRCFTFAA